MASILRGMKVRERVNTPLPPPGSNRGVILACLSRP